jgi:mannose-6-phosphate isomerase-like protein (cupin superfamily)
MTTETTIKPDRAAGDRAYTLPDREGQPARWWLGGHLAVKTRAADTDGRFCQIEFSDPCGMAPPVHIHHWEDETFYVLEGLVTVFVGDSRIDVSKGEFVFMPRELPHTYLVRSERARALVTYAPAGVEQFFIEMGLPVTDPDQPPAPVVPDHDVFAREMGRYGVELVGPPPTLEQ